MPEAAAQVLERPIVNEPIKVEHSLPTTPVAEQETTAVKVSQELTQAGHPSSSEEVLAHGAGTAASEKIQRQHPGVEVVDEFMHDARRVIPQIFTQAYFTNEAKPGRFKIAKERAKKLANHLGKSVILDNLTSLLKKRKV